MQFVDKDLKSVQEARILVESARDAHVLLKEYGQQDLDRVIDKLMSDILIEIPELVDLEIAETKAGVKKDKLKLFEEFLPILEDKLKNQKVIGSLKENSHNQIETIGVSLGVVAVLLPTENIILNSLYATLIAIKSGNTVILVPQPRTEKVVARFYSKVAHICQESGLPQGAIGYMENTADEGVTQILAHPDTALVIDIGVPKYFDNNQVVNKPMIYGGTGSTPVFFEHTADIAQAAKSVVDSRSFDNGLLPAAEQFVLAEGVIANEVKSDMTEAGAYFLSDSEEEQLLGSLFLDEDHVNPLFVGQSATWLAKQSGFSVPENTKVLVSEKPYIFDENPFTNELKCPILTFYVEPDWMHACEKCIRLLKTKRNGHTLAIYSKDEAVIKEFALKKPVGRMIVNGPASFSSIGINSTLPVSLILGGLTTGRGFISKNVVAENLTYQRDIGYTKPNIRNHVQVQEVTQEKDISADKELLAKVLKKIMDQ